MRQQIAAANWKMNLTLEEASKLLDDILSGPQQLKSHQKVIFAVPFPYLQMAGTKISGNANYHIAAQNCYTKKSGAYTGETSVDMIRSVGAAYVVLGHSERREYFNESNTMLAEKVNIVLDNELIPLFCCGEPLPVRGSDSQNAYVEKQLEESLFHLSNDQITRLVIAYEPIWAIGTGKTATAAQAQEMHAHLRNVLAKRYGNEVADNIPILYGGSVKGSNAKELFSQPDVDGGLVGGASLLAAEFGKIIEALK
ncbi:MAG: triose-phosphate isomerase [Chitinophagaceae bacterium]|nr:triose-phosphate isomerase [Chitinophagaceae bacterium]